MGGFAIRNIEVNEYRNIYKHIKQDFAEGEYAPYSVFRRQLKYGIQEGLILQKEGNDIAYAVCAEGHENRYVLISLLAVYKEFRNSGFGSAFIEEIKRKYKDKNGIIVEVEKIEKAESQDDKTVRLKRIGFYEKNGFYKIPHIDYSIWDVPMYLMVYPQNVPAERINKEIGRIIHEIYLKLMGKHFIHKLKFSMK